MKLAPDEIARLSPDERLALIAQLWDSLDEDQIPITAAQQEELQHRLAALENGRLEGTSWESLKAELEKRCP